MQILLLSATIPECRPCFEWLDANADLPVTRLVTGVGQMQTAVALQKSISLQCPDLIIQAGIGGAASAADISRVFTIESEMLADLGADEKEGFRDWFELKLADPQTAPFIDGKLMNPWHKLMKLTGFDRRPGLTVNRISTDRNLLEQRKQKYPSFVESMEGAALHYVALKETIPFLQLRSISNEAGERDKSRWQLKGSVAALNDALITVIQKLSDSDELHSWI